MIVKIALWTLIIVTGSWIIYDLIPEHIKQYWNYLKSIRKDKRKGLKGKYIWTWKK